MLAPVLFWRWSWLQRLLYPTLTVLILLPFGLHAGWGLGQELNGRGLFGALLIYSSQWKFNSGLFYGLETILGGAGSVAATTAAKLLIGGGMLVVLIVVFILARQQDSPRATLRLAGLPLMAYVLLTPTFHPWYLLILLAFVPFLPPGAGESRLWWLAALPWLWLSGTAVFSYLAYLDPVSGGFKAYELADGAAPHNLIIDDPDPHDSKENHAPAVDSFSPFRIVHTRTCRFVHTRVYGDGPVAGDARAGARPTGRDPAARCPRFSAHAGVRSNRFGMGVP